MLYLRSSLGVFLCGIRLLSGHGISWRDGRFLAAQERLCWIRDAIRRPRSWFCFGMELSSEIREFISYQYTKNKPDTSIKLSQLIVTPNNINAAGVVVQYWTRSVHNRYLDG